MGLGGTTTSEPASANRVRLMEANYAFDEALGLWINRELDRAIDAGIAERLTPEQLGEWIAVGRKIP